MAALRSHDVSDTGESAKPLDDEPEIILARRASRRLIYSVAAAALAGVMLALLAAVVIGAMGLAQWRDAFFGTNDIPSAPPIAVDGYRAGALISGDELERLGAGLREKRADEDRAHAERLKALDETMATAQERLKLEDPAARFGPDFAVQPPADAR